MKNQIFQRLHYLISILDSTSHAVVRCSVEVSQTDTLMRILNNRLKFGLFLDDYTHIFLLNYFLKKDNYRDASKTAILMMHQEEFDVPIAKELGTCGDASHHIFKGSTEISYIETP